jgi:hypothetical protein
MIVYAMPDRWKHDRRIEDFPVAVRPWMLRSDGDGRWACGCQRDQVEALSTYSIQRGELLYLVLTA